MLFIALLFILLIWVCGLGAAALAAVDTYNEMRREYTQEVSFISALLMVVFWPVVALSYVLITSYTAIKQIVTGTHREKS